MAAFMLARKDAPELQSVFAYMFTFSYFTVLANIFHVI